MVFFLSLLLSVAVFLGVSGLFMLSWNYAAPRIAQSMHSDLFDLDHVRPLSYGAAIVTLITVGFLFPAANTLNSLNPDYWVPIVEPYIK